MSTGGMSWLQGGVAVSTLVLQQEGPDLTPGRVLSVWNLYFYKHASLVNWCP